MEIARVAHIKLTLLKRRLLGKCLCSLASGSFSDKKAFEKVLAKITSNCKFFLL